MHPFAVTTSFRNFAKFLSKLFQTASEIERDCSRTTLCVLLDVGTLVSHQVEDDKGQVAEMLSVLRLGNRYNFAKSCTDD